MVKNELAEELLREDKLQAITTPAEFAQKVRETLAKVHNDSFNATEERPEPPKAIGVQTESIAAETAGAPVATTQPAVQLSAELEQLKKQLEEATKLAESRSQEARAADEKAKKLAVKANQADKLKAMANDLKAKLAELQNAKAGTSMLSVKGGAAAQATSPGNSAVNAIDVAGSAGSSGDANAPVGAVSVRGRGTARGTATRARVRGGARPATRGINPQAILSRKSLMPDAPCSPLTDGPCSPEQRSTRNSVERTIPRAIRCRSSDQLPLMASLPPRKVMKRASV